MLNLLHNPYVYPALVVVVMLVACVHVYRHDSPALLSKRLYWCYY